ncbi:7913_t:CDS:2, partial [Paraglomus occultum]
EPICSNIIDTTNKLLMDRLQIKRDYTWNPVTNEATKYIDELIDNSDTRYKFRSKLQLPFVSPDETYSFSKHYEIHWVHRFADKLSLFFEAPRNPLLDKNSEGWLNCHVLTPLIDDCFLTCEEIQIHRGEEISLASTERKNLLRDDSETYVDEDPQNSKPISYKHKILREMKDQLDRLLKRLKFTRETIKWIKNIVVHGINQGGLNGKIYAMYYDNDLQYYFVFETCRYRIGTTWGSIPESLMSLKDILRLKEDINNALDIVKKIKLIALRTKSEDLFTIDNLPETTLVSRCDDTPVSDISDNASNSNESNNFPASDVSDDTSNSGNTPDLSSEHILAQSKLPEDIINDDTAEILNFVETKYKERVSEEIMERIREKKLRDQNLSLDNEVPLQGNNNSSCDSESKSPTNVSPNQRAYTEETGLDPWIKSETSESPQSENTDNHIIQDNSLEIQVTAPNKNRLYQYAIEHGINPKEFSIITEAEKNRWAMGCFRGDLERDIVSIVVE